MNRTLRCRGQLILALMVASSADPAIAQEGPLSLEQIDSRSVAAVPNGDFEQGRTVWTESSTNGFTLIRKLAEVGLVARIGEWGAILGIANREMAYIEQTVAIPVSATMVSFWYQLGSTETDLGFDFARVIVNGWDIIDEFHLFEDEAVTNWTLNTADISAYAGQTVMLRIAVEIDPAEPSTLVLDDIQFDADGPTDRIFSDGFESGSTLAWSAEVP